MASGLQTDLVGLWQFRETSLTGASGEIKDTSGRQNHAVRVGSATTSASGRFGRGLLLNGTSDSVRVESFTGFPSGYATRTLCGWGMAYSGDTNQWIASVGSSSSANSFFIGRTGASLVAGNFSDTLTATNFWSVDRWHHVCLVYDGSMASLYGDGRLLAGPVAKSWNLEWCSNGEPDSPALSSWSESHSLPVPHVWAIPVCG